MNNISIRKVDVAMNHLTGKYSNKMIYITIKTTNDNLKFKLTTFLKLNVFKLLVFTCVSISRSFSTHEDLRSVFHFMYVLKKKK